MLDRYTTGPRKPKYIEGSAGLIAAAGHLFPDHKALDDLGYAGLVDRPRDVLGKRLESRGSVNHGHAEAGPANHVLIVGVVADGTHIRLRDPEPVSHHRKGTGRGAIRLDAFNEPI